MHRFLYSGNGGPSSTDTLATVNGEPSSDQGKHHTAIPPTSEAPVAYCTLRAVSHAWGSGLTMAILPPGSWPRHTATVPFS